MSVFNTVQAAVQATGAYGVLHLRPGTVRRRRDPGGAADAGLDPIVAITEGIPVLDMLRVYHTVRQRGARLIGPERSGAD